MAEWWIGAMVFVAIAALVVVFNDWRSRRRAHSRHAKD